MPRPVQATVVSQVPDLCAQESMRHGQCRVGIYGSILRVEAGEQLPSDDHNRLQVLISELPDRLKAEYDMNWHDFGGTTYYMKHASSNMIGNLKNMWIDLVTAGVPSKVLGMSPAVWIERYVESQMDLYRSLNWQENEGTILPIEVMGDTIDDLHALIARTVRPLMGGGSDYEKWAKRWEAAAKPPP